jgi:hypothetical protein
MNTPKTYSDGHDEGHDVGYETAMGVMTYALRELLPSFIDGIDKAPDVDRFADGFVDDVVGLAVATDPATLPKERT